MCMFTLLLSWVIYFWSKINFLKEKQISPHSRRGKEEMMGPSRLVYLVRQLAPLFTPEGVCAKMVARAPRMLPDTIFFNSTLKSIFRLKRNSSHSIPVLLTTYMSPSMFSFFFSLMWPTGKTVSCSRSIKFLQGFTRVRLVFEDGFHGSGCPGLLPAG